MGIPEGMQNHQRTMAYRHINTLPHTSFSPHWNISGVTAGLCTHINSCMYFVHTGPTGQLGSHIDMVIREERDRAYLKYPPTPLLSLIPFSSSSSFPYTLSSYTIQKHCLSLQTVFHYLFRIIKTQWWESTYELQTKMFQGCPVFLCLRLS